MAYHLRLSNALRKARWKVKIRDKETRETPHVTIIRGTLAWRINLRNGQFMDAQPDPADLPSELTDAIIQEETWQRLRDAWDRMYPNNPVSSEGENEE